MCVRSFGRVCPRILAGRIALTARSQNVIVLNVFIIEFQYNMNIIIMRSVVRSLKCMGRSGSEFSCVWAECTGYSCLWRGTDWYFNRILQ